MFVVGLQRSGTNMLVRGLEASPEFEVHNEDDTKAFRRFRLKSNDQIRALVTRSGHSYILFKPLCDSCRCRSSSTTSVRQVLARLSGSIVTTRAGALGRRDVRERQPERAA